MTSTKGKHLTVGKYDWFDSGALAQVAFPNISDKTQDYTFNILKNKGGSRMPSPLSNTFLP